MVAIAYSRWEVGATAIRVNLEKFKILIVVVPACR